MLFNSVNFFLFFPAVVLLYYLLPQKVRSLWLLAASYFFYMCWNPKYAVLLLFCTLITYSSGLLIDRFRENKRMGKLIAATGVVLSAGILFFFKYFDFFISSLNRVFTKVGISLIDLSFDVMLPIGISFYVFKSLSYIIDVYRNKIKAENNIIKYALYVSFFPQIASGPIERAGNFLPQLDEKHGFDAKNVKNGLLLMLWGFFLKLVIADRAAIIVNSVYENYNEYTGGTLLIASLLFSVQIYCDFAGYSAISIGAAQVMDFKTIENFNTPYFARSIQEFWHRWHISLSLWFRDYVYIPLGGNRCSKLRRYFNILVTFLVSGLWHGAGLNFIIWGGLHGAYQIIGDFIKPLKEKTVRFLKIDVNSFAHKAFQTVFTFLLVNFAWIFFRAPGVRAALHIIREIVMDLNLAVLTDGSLYGFGVEQNAFSVLLMATASLFIVSLIKRKKDVRTALSAQPLWFRWMMYFALLFAVILFGLYGSEYNTADFIYAQF